MGRMDPKALLGQQAPLDLTGRMGRLGLPGILASLAILVGSGRLAHRDLKGLRESPVVDSTASTMRRHRNGDQYSERSDPRPRHTGVPEYLCAAAQRFRSARRACSDRRGAVATRFFGRRSWRFAGAKRRDWPHGAGRTDRATGRHGRAGRAGCGGTVGHAGSDWSTGPARTSRRWIDCASGTARTRRATGGRWPHRAGWTYGTGRQPWT